MSLRPHESHVRFVGYDGDRTEPEYICVVPWCTAAAMDAHHIWSRRQHGRAFNYTLDTETGDVLSNLADVCRSHHQDLTDNRARIHYSEQDKAYDWESLVPIPDTPDHAPLKIEAVCSPLSELHGTLQPEPVPSPQVPVGLAEPDDEHRGEVRPNDHAGLLPGSTCPTCERKVPHVKKTDSPSSRTKAFRIPNDELEAFTELLDAAEKIVGVKEQPFSTYKVLLAALALVVQSPGEVRELLERRAA